MVDLNHATLIVEGYPTLKFLLKRLWKTLVWHWNSLKASVKNCKVRVTQNRLIFGFKMGRKVANFWPTLKGV